MAPATESPLNSGPTPFEVSLKHELEGEFMRMANEWFFKWHNINMAGKVVDVEDFYGGRFRTGGILFQGQLQGLYWRSVGKYLTDKAHAVLERWSVESRAYPLGFKKSSLEGVSSQLWGFTARVVAHGVDVDRRLRGRGDPRSVIPYNGSETQTPVNAEIERLKAAYALLIQEAPAAPVSLSQRVESFLSSKMGMLTAFGVLIAVATLALSLK